MASNHGFNVNIGAAVKKASLSLSKSIADGIGSQIQEGLNGTVFGQIEARYQLNQQQIDKSEKEALQTIKRSKKRIQKELENPVELKQIYQFKTESTGRRRIEQLSGKLNTRQLVDSNDLATQIRDQRQLEKLVNSYESKHGKYSGDNLFDYKSFLKNSNIESQYNTLIESQRSQANKSRDELKNNFLTLSEEFRQSGVEQASQVSNSQEVVSNEVDESQKKIVGSLEKSQQNIEQALSKRSSTIERLRDKLLKYSEVQKQYSELYEAYKIQDPAEREQRLGHLSEQYPKIYQSTDGRKDAYKKLLSTNEVLGSYIQKTVETFNQYGIDLQAIPELPSLMDLVDYDSEQKYSQKYKSELNSIVQELMLASNELKIAQSDLNSQTSKLEPITGQIISEEDLEKAKQALKIQEDRRKELEQSVKSLKTELDALKSDYKTVTEQKEVLQKRLEERPSEDEYNSEVQNYRALGEDYKKNVQELEHYKEELGKLQGEHGVDLQQGQDGNVSNRIEEYKLKIASLQEQVELLNAQLSESNKKLENYFEFNNSKESNEQVLQSLKKEIEEHDLKIKQKNAQIKNAEQELQSKQEQIQALNNGINNAADQGNKQDKNIISSEEKSVEGLENGINNVIAEIEEKTAQFNEEANVVSIDVDSEISDLDRLQKKIESITGQTETGTSQFNSGLANANLEKQADSIAPEKIIDSKKDIQKKLKALSAKKEKTPEEKYLESANKQIGWLFKKFGISNRSAQAEEIKQEILEAVKTGVSDASKEKIDVDLDDFIQVSPLDDGFDFLDQLQESDSKQSNIDKITRKIRDNQSAAVPKGYSQLAVDFARSSNGSTRYVWRDVIDDQISELRQAGIETNRQKIISRMGRGWKISDQETDDLYNMFAQIDEAGQVFKHDGPQDLSMSLARLYQDLLAYKGGKNTFGDDAISQIGSSVSDINEDVQTVINNLISSREKILGIKPQLSDVQSSVESINRSSSENVQILQEQSVAEKELAKNSTSAAEVKSDNSTNNSNIPFQQNAEKQNILDSVSEQQASLKKTFTTELNDLSLVDMAIEEVTEDVNLKTKQFETEAKSVSKYIDDEIQDLKRLEEKIGDIKKLYPLSDNGQTSKQQNINSESMPESKSSGKNVGSNIVADSFQFLTKNQYKWQTGMDDYLNNRLSGDRLRNFLDLDSQMKNAENIISAAQKQGTDQTERLIDARKKYNQECARTKLVIEQANDELLKSAQNEAILENKQRDKQAQEQQAQKKANQEKRERDLTTKYGKIIGNNNKGQSSREIAVEYLRTLGSSQPDPKFDIKGLNNDLTQMTTNFTRADGAAMKLVVTVDKLNGDIRASVQPDTLAEEKAIGIQNRLYEAQKKEQDLLAKRDANFITDTELGKLEEATAKVSLLEEELKQTGITSDRLNKLLGENGKKLVAYAQGKQGEFEDILLHKYGSKKGVARNTLDARNKVVDFVSAQGGIDLSELAFGFADNRGWQTASASFKMLNGQAQQLKQSFNEQTGELRVMTAEQKKAPSSFSSFLKAFSTRWQGLLTYLGSFASFYKIVEYLRQGVAYVRELDQAFVELRKVSNDTASQLEEFRKNSFNLGKEVGATGSQIIQAAAGWEQLGYSIKDASELSQVSTIYQNVADGMGSAQEATEDLISVMKAFYHGDASRAIDVVDALNEVSNNYAVSAADLGGILKRSSSAMSVANNSFEETLAMGTAMNEILQNQETAGATLKMLSLRIRGAKAELEEAGEDVENMADSSSKLQAEIKGLTGGFDILEGDGKTFKSTYEIMKGIAAVWDDMTDVSRAALLEKIAGKNRAQGVQALLTNWSQVDKVLKTISEDEGSAERENQVRMESISGRITKLQNQAQELSSILINQDVLKEAISQLTKILELVTNISQIKLGPDWLNMNVGFLKPLMAIGGGIIGSRKDQQIPTRSLKRYVVTRNEKILFFKAA